MQAINGIQNAMINTNTVENGMVVDAANAHRTYLPYERLRPVSKRPHFGVFGSQSLTDKRDLKQSPSGQDSGNDLQSMCSGRKRRIDSRHLPGAAWAMLVLNRSLCG